MTGANHARWAGYFKDAEPRIGDELSTWTKRQLETMDANFVRAMQRAIARGKERPIAGSSAPHDRELVAARARAQQEGERPRA